MKFKRKKGGIKLARHKNIDMCNGPLLKNILLYSLPLIATGVLQLLYNMADSIVVAKWAGGEALAAVGSTGSLINLVTNVFIGLSIGASVVVSHYYGAERRTDVHQAVHTAITLSVVAGVLTMIVGLLVSHPALKLMGTQPEVLDQATLYVRIYFIGMPASMVYNFAAAILRSIGDTKRPFYILVMSGLVNIILNLFFVIVLHWDVAGVAAATAVSQLLSAALTLWCLIKAHDCYRLELSKLRLHREKALLMLRYGIPAGIQGSIFSISNMLIQSSINSFGVAAMSGSAASSNIEGLVYISMNSIYQTCMAFTGQNLGAGKAKRVVKAQRLCSAVVVAVGLITGALVITFGRQLLTFYTAASSVETAVSSEQIISYGMQRLTIIAATYFLCGLMEVQVGSLRGMGVSVVPMIVSIIGVCGVRIVWILTVFRTIDHTLESLFISYPVSWAATAFIHFMCLLAVRKKRLKNLQPIAVAASGAGGEADLCDEAESAAGPSADSAAFADETAHADEAARVDETARADETADSALAAGSAAEPSESSAKQAAQRAD